MNLSNYLKGIQKELKLTTFPKKEIVINFTIFVIVFTAIMSVYLGGLDLGFGEAVLNSINSVNQTEPLVEIASTTISTSTEATSTLINTTTTK